MEASERRRRASEEAAAWWVRLQAGESGREEREEFVDWLRESALHVAAMLRVAKVNDSLEAFQGWMQINTEGPEDDEDRVVALSTSTAGVPGAVQPISPRKHAWAGLVTVGVTLAALVAVGFIISLRAQVVATDRGERREVALADGSVVEVDPETRLRVAFEEHTRRVVLERGRALFKVAKNPARPFLVQANDTTVRAVGTAFGVELGEQGIVVTVAEGKVSVAATDHSTAPPPTVTGTASPSSAREVLLTAGQQVRMPLSGGGNSLRKVDSERELAWSRGQLVFDNATVAAAVKEFNRYNRVQMRVAGNLGLRRVSAILDASDPESFIAFLQTEGTVRVARHNSEIDLQ